MKKGATELLKFQKLKRRLHLPMWGVVGVLESLWKATERNAPAGDIGRLSDEDIAAAIEWDGDPGDLIQTLIETGWIDRHPEHRLVIHDWRDHVPTYMVGAFARHGKEFAANPVPSKVLAEAATEVAREPATDPASYPIPSNPIQSKPKPSAVAEGFARFYAAYPLKHSKGQAERAWNKLAPDASLLTSILSAIEAQKADRIAASKAGAFRPEWKHPATWLNAQAWLDEIQPVEAPRSKSDPKPPPRTGLTPAEQARVEATYAADAKRRAELSAPVSEDAKAAAAAFLKAHVR